MAQIDLPRPLHEYFAFAELASTRHGRRFTITFPYFEAQRLDRLQWWWQVSTVQERVGGEAGLESLRREAIERFRLHIERWLVTSQKRLFDGNPFPRLGAQGRELVPAVAEQAEPAATSNVVAWPVDRVANA